MGEMSDYHLESADYFGERLGGSGKLPITCRYCGAYPLRWSSLGDDGGWRLIDEDGSVHACPEYRKAKVGED